MKTGFPRILIVLLIVGFVFGTLIVVGGVTAYRKWDANRHAISDFKAVSEQITKDAQSRFEKGETVEGSADKAKQLQDAMGAAASKLSGTEAKGFRGMQRFMGSMQTHIAAYEKAYTGFLSKGGLELKSLTGEGAVDERIALLKTFSVANEDFTAFLKGADGTLRAELAKEDFPPAKIAEAAEGFARGANLQTMVAIRGTDSELCVIMGRYLDILKNEAGKWTMNESGSAVFQNSPAADAFNQCADQIKEVADRQAALQQKMLKARQQGRGAAVPPAP